MMTSIYSVISIYFHEKVKLIGFLQAKNAEIFLRDMLKSIELFQRFGNETNFEFIFLEKVTGTTTTTEIK